MKKLILTAALSSMALSATKTAIADEGMWQPHQLPSLEKELKKAGLKLDPNDLTELTEFPMGAIVSLGGCSAAFLSPQGLVATNHHCTYGSIQFNSTAEDNLIEKGFLAKSLKEELKAAPGSRVFVTEEVSKVTDKVIGDLADTLSGIDRYKAIEKNRKQLISDCESAEGYRCRVSAFHGGLEYYLIKQMEIKDVRLVYAPAGAIGKYGGDIDNWMWPRHTGDFSFYRAYVSKDGKPVEYSEDNVPYEPKHFLKVNANGVQDGDFVMIAGYPGSTNRYRTSVEVKNQFEWYYPTFRKVVHNYIDIIEKNAPEGSDARVKYASTLASLNNVEKNWGSMIESYGKGDFLQRKTKLETSLANWLDTDKKMSKKHRDSINALNALILEDQKEQETDLKLWAMSRDALSTTAANLYRLALEKQKPDAEREPGYQERDMTRFEEGLKRFNRRWDEKVAKELYKYFITEYATLPLDQRVKSFDKTMGIGEKLDSAKFAKTLNQMFTNTKLTDERNRLDWMNKSVEDFKNSTDPFIQLAVATYDENYQRELKSKQRSGQFQQLRPKYMAAMIDYYDYLGKPIYADANSTLRVTYGNVKGYSPKDGVYSVPFTTLEGLLAKHTGEEPFNSPKAQNKLIKERKYGNYLDKSLNSVQVNYLTTVDITGGNSGSSTLNDKAEFVGLVFDGNYESIIGDWDYDPNLKRGIHVSSAYMLWVMEHIDDADNLIKEMTIIR